jgi:hypothetical protein
MIQKLRQKEISDYVKLNIGKAIERAFGNSIAGWSGLLMFITAQYTLNNLTTALIFSTLELMAFLKIQIFFFSIGVGFYY